MTATVIKDIHALAIESLTDIKVRLPCMSPTRLCYQIFFSFLIVSHDLQDSIALNQKELGVGPCLATDIWGENGISLLGVLGY
jgi:hypothetical protein